MCDKNSCSFPEFHILTEEIVKSLELTDERLKRYGYQETDYILIPKTELSSLMHNIFIQGYYFERSCLLSSIRKHKCNNCGINLDRHFKSRAWKVPLCKRCRERYKLEYKWFEEKYGKELKEARAKVSRI